MRPLKPNDIVFTKQDVIERAEFSNTQIKRGQVLSQKGLEAQSKKMVVNFPYKKTIAAIMIKITTRK